MKKWKAFTTPPLRLDSGGLRNSDWSFCASPFERYFCRIREDATYWLEASPRRLSGAREFWIHRNADFTWGEPRHTWFADAKICKWPGAIHDFLQKANFTLGSVLGLTVGESTKIWVRLWEQLDG